MPTKPLVIISHTGFPAARQITSGSLFFLKMTALEFSADAGLVAVILATANICLGLLISTRYSPWRLWPHRKINIFAVHNYTAYVLLAFIAIHIVPLLFVSRPRWRIRDLLLPLDSPVQPLENAIGAISMYLVVTVVVTSYFRLRLGRRRWKRFHYLVYAAAIGLFTHGLLANPQLTSSAIDPWDGEKLLVEFCFLIVAGMTGWAWRYRVRKAREEKTRQGVLAISNHRASSDFLRTAPPDIDLNPRATLGRRSTRLWNRLS